MNLFRSAEIGFLEVKKQFLI